MRVCITGCTGFVGSHLTERLLADGQEVTGIARRWPGNLPLSGFTDEERGAGAWFDFIACDLRRECIPLDGYDAVLHLAARAGMAPSWAECDSYLESNVIATRRVLDECVRAKVGRLVYVSSSSVLGNATDSEDVARYRPLSPYGVSKAAAEMLCNAYRQASGLEVVIVRPFSIYGPRQRPDMFQHIAIEAILTGAPLVIDGDGEQSRSVTYVTDLVDGIVRAMETPEARGETFHLGGEQVYSVNDTLRLVEEITGIKANRRQGPPKRGDQRQTRANIWKARELLGWEPAVDYPVGLAAQIAWQRERLRVCA